MTYKQSDVDKAVRIFVHLLREQMISAGDRELFRAYQEPAVREILEEIIEKHAEVKLLASDQAIYLSPSVDNVTFGYTNQELRQTMKLNSNKELYLAYFVILTLLSMFYNSNDQMARTRQYVELKDLERYVTDQMERVAAADPQDVRTVEEDVRMNLATAAEVWLDLQPFDDNVQFIGRARNNRISFIHRVVRFLEQENLLTLLEEREIRPTSKLDQIMISYYFHTERKQRVLSMLSRPLPFILGEESSDAAN